ncbi:hypothetical protein [Kitasatospora purpeofusca]|uniref:DUF732 domain-containing protein n=1 Tax=Kitasatospora purpeofusca TaxID=67352 RepID=A0ABZ1U1K5_9ACTN|nr:hypothetical protein [Kitasatospora purpeofusca]
MNIPGGTMRTRTTSLALVAAALLAAGLTACSSSATNTNAKASTAPTTSAAAAPASSPAAAPTSAPAAPAPAPAGTTTAAPAATGPGGLPPKPDAATQLRYIAALTAIDPEIVGDKTDRAVSRGRDQCSSIAQKKSEAELVALTGQRFTSPQHPNGFGAEKSAKILEAVRKHICPAA